MEVSETSGILILDKPADMSSAKAVANVKRILKARKVGHAGTLDPFATGVLVCCVNQATRLAQFFLHGRKKYCAVMHLGVETDTQDVTGRVISSTATVGLTAECVEATVKQFEGFYWQHPPAYSALKLRGVPLYRYARQGRPVQICEQKEGPNLNPDNSAQLGGATRVGDARGGHAVVAGDSRRCRAEPGRRPRLWRRLRSCWRGRASFLRARPTWENHGAWACRKREIMWMRWLPAACIGFPGTPSISGSWCFWPAPFWLLLFFQRP